MIIESNGTCSVGGSDWIELRRKREKEDGGGD